MIRYLVVTTGEWLANRKVLMSPFALGRPDWTQKFLPVSLTTEQVKHSPNIDTDKPVSRQHELEFLEYCRYPSYWGGVGLWDIGPNPNLLGLGSGLIWSADHYSQALSRLEQAKKNGSPRDDPHLRSCNAVVKYHIASTDGDIGHVHGLLVDDETWAIRYLIVNTSNWWLGHQVLVAPQWIEEISWFDSKVHMDLSRQTLKDAPAYDSTLPLDRQREVELFEYYGRAGYWAVDLSRESAK